MYFQIVIFIFTIAVVSNIVYAIHNPYGRALKNGGAELIALCYVFIFFLFVPVFATGHTESLKVEVKQYLYDDIRNELVVKLSTNEIAEFYSYDIINGIQNGQKHLYLNSDYNFYGWRMSQSYTLSPEYKLKSN